MSFASNIHISIPANASPALKNAVQASGAVLQTSAQQANWLWMPENDVEQGSGQRIVTATNTLADLAKLEAAPANLHIGFAPWRTAPAVQWLAKLLKSGTLGRVCMVEWNVFLSDRNRTSDPLNDTLIPYLDLQQWLFGEVFGLQALAAPATKRTPEAQAGLISCRIGTDGIGLMAYTNRLWKQHMETSLVVLAEHGSIKLEGAYLDKITYCKAAASTPENLGSAAPEATTLQWMQQISQHIPTPAFTARDAKAVRELTERIYALRNEQHVRKTA